MLTAVSPPCTIPHVPYGPVIFCGNSTRFKTHFTSGISYHNPKLNRALIRLNLFGTKSISSTCHPLNKGSLTRTEIEYQIGLNQYLKTRSIQSGMYVEFCTFRNKEAEYRSLLIKLFKSRKTKSEQVVRRLEGTLSTGLWDNCSREIFEVKLERTIQFLENPKPCIFHYYQLQSLLQMGSPLEKICYIHEASDKQLRRYIKALHLYQSIMDTGVIPKTHSHVRFIGIEKKAREVIPHAFLSDHSAGGNPLD